MAFIWILQKKILGWDGMEANSKRYDRARKEDKSWLSERVESQIQSIRVQPKEGRTIIKDPSIYP